MPCTRETDAIGAVDLDVADALEELGGPGAGEGLGELVAPGLVLGLGVQSSAGAAAHRTGLGFARVGRLAGAPSPAGERTARVLAGYRRTAVGREPWPGAPLRGS